MSPTTGCQAPRYRCDAIFLGSRRWRQAPRHRRDGSVPTQTAPSCELRRPSATTTFGSSRRRRWTSRPPSRSASRAGKKRLEAGRRRLARARLREAREQVAPAAVLRGLGGVRGSAPRRRSRDLVHGPVAGGSLPDEREAAAPGAVGCGHRDRVHRVLADDVVGRGSADLHAAARFSRTL